MCVADSCYFSPFLYDGHLLLFITVGNATKQIDFNADGFFYHNLDIALILKVLNATAAGDILILFIFFREHKS